MPASEREHHARVHQHAGFFIDCLLENLWRQTRHAWQIAENLRPLRIDLLHQGIVFGHRRGSAEGVLLELFEVGELQEGIKFPLIADGALHPVANVRAAWRAVAVCRIDRHAVGEREIKAAQGLEELLGELLGFARAEQVRPACRAHEERVARQHAPRRVGMILFGDHIADVLGGVSRCVPRDDDGVA